MVILRGMATTLISLMAGSLESCRELSTSATATHMVTLHVAWPLGHSPSTSMHSVTSPKPLMKLVHTSSSLLTVLPLNVFVATGNLMMLPEANPMQAPCYEEYEAMYTPVIVGPVYVSTEERRVPNGMTEVVVPARMVNIVGRKPEGMCLWTGGVRSKRRGVPVGVLMVGVLITTLGLV